MIAQNIAFYATAAVMVVGALAVVTSKNVVRAALYLVAVLAGAAALYILLAAEFVAIVQVIIYIGAVVVLLLFGVMLTRAPIGRDVGLDNDQRWVGAIVAILLFGLLGSVVIDAFHRQKIAFGTIFRTGDVGYSILGPYLIPFEVVSILLLAAVIGGIAIARRD